MEKEQALFLANLMENSYPVGYEVKKLATVGGTLLKFHQWTNEKQTIGAYEVTRIESANSYYYIFIDWHRNDNYYLVIYTHNKSTTCAEIRQIKELEGGAGPHLIWTYQPLKRDGKNNQRKAYFMQLFGTKTLQIKMPSSPFEVEEFYEQLFKLCQNRIQADRIAEVFDIEG
ncbi:MAG: hypothetical protein K6T88_02020 [Bacillus sp. (in: Bacteria)]|nr:hypothetical protein [Bacillus sp. (in: firmicutes)]